MKGYLLGERRLLGLPSVETKPVIRESCKSPLCPPLRSGILVASEERAKGGLSKKLCLIVQSRQLEMCGGDRSFDRLPATSGLASATAGARERRGML